MSIALIKCPNALPLSRIMNCPNTSPIRTLHIQIRWEYQKVPRIQSQNFGISSAVLSWKSIPSVCAHMCHLLGQKHKWPQSFCVTFFLCNLHGSQYHTDSTSYCMKFMSCVIHNVIYKQSGMFSNYPTYILTTSVSCET